MADRRTRRQPRPHADATGPEPPAARSTDGAGASQASERTRARRARERRRAQQRRNLLAIAALVAFVAVAAFAVAQIMTPGEDGTGAPTGAGRPSASGMEATAAPSPAAKPADEPAPEAASPQTAAKVVEIGWVGDTTPGSKYGNPPNKGRALFEHTREYTSKPDIMVANLEGTFGKGGASKCDGRDSSVCYAFQAPPANAAALKWAGIDVVNLANNHSNDYLAAGLKSTRKALEANDIGYTGLDGITHVEEVDGVKVAFIGFSPYAWSPNIGKLEKAKSLVKEADREADVVVVLMHAGAEGADKTRTPKGAETAYGEFRGDSRAFSHAVIDAGADLVLGSGPHVVRGVERYKDRLIAYSLGNFAGWKNFSRSGNLALSGLLKVKIAGDGRVLGGKWTSMRIVEPGVPKIDSSRASLALVRKVSDKDFKTPVDFAKDGTFTFDAEQSE